MTATNIASIVLPWDAPPLTQNGLRRMHYYVEAREKARALNDARWAIRAAGITPLTKANVTLHWRAKDRRRRDGDGAAPTLKVVLDALVAEGVLPDDSWQHVPHSGVTIHEPSETGGAVWVEVSPC